MNLTFTNGSAIQQDIVQAAIHSLLHLDLAAFQFDLEVSFVADPIHELHNEFAGTDTDVTPTTMRIRDDFPHFAGPEWDSTAFALESVAHELGHALTAKLDAPTQAALATLFGTTVATWREGATWQDQPYEGIAETFKDAFVPANMRAYFNRTNHSIPYSKYPYFRSLYRAGGLTSDLGRNITRIYAYGSVPEFDPPGASPVPPVYLGGAEDATSFVTFGDGTSGVYLGDIGDAGFLPYRIALTDGEFPPFTAPPGFKVIQFWDFAEPIVTHTSVIEVLPTPSGSAQEPPPPSEVTFTGMASARDRGKRSHGQRVAAPTTN